MRSRAPFRRINSRNARPLVFIRTARTQPAYQKEIHEAEQSTNEPDWNPSLANPRQLVDYLHQYVVGQHRAKKILSVAVYNHYNRIHANLGHKVEESSPWVETVTASAPNEPNLLPHPTRRRTYPTPAPRSPAPLPDPIIGRSNILIIGPTGSGKTLLVRTLAKALDVPFSTSDATTFTQAGYVGDDVEMCVHRLLQSANWDPDRAATGIIYIDEADKIARRGPGGDGMQRDIGGEGVQQSLLRMMEGSVMTINMTRGADGAGPPPNEGRRGKGAQPPSQESFQVDTSNVLFILSGAFVGLDNIVKQRIAKGSIGFGAPLATKNEESSDFVPFFTKNGEKADLWSMVEPADMVTFGFIPEFVSRLPIISSVSQLTIPDLLRVLTEVKGSLVSQYTALFGYSGVEIRFTTLALREVARLAKERGGGARGLRGIMENLLLDAMYEVPGSGVRYVLINQKVAKGEISALYWSRGDASVFWNEFQAEEEMEKDYLNAQEL